MNDIPWISAGGEVTIVGGSTTGMRGKRGTDASFVPSDAGPYPDVKVKVDGQEKTLKCWQVVDEGFRTSHRTEELAPDLLFFEWQGYENNGNTVVVGDKTKIIIDSGHFGLLGSLLVALDEKGLGLDSFEALLFTHCHPDHFDSAGLLQQAGLEVGAHSEERAYILGEGGLLFQFFGSSVPDIDYTLSLEEGNVAVGGLEFQVLHTPGHSPGSVCLYWKDRKALIVGDVVFPGGAFGRCDFPGGSYKVLLESVGRLDGLDIEFLLSGHGPAIKGKDEVTQSIESSKNNLRSVIFSPW